MKYMRLILASFLILAMALPAAADKLSLQEISGYLNGFRTAQSTFIQVNADGSRSKGTIYLKRPGRARFEYAGRDEGLVMAGGGQVAIFDPKSNNPPEQFPLKRTPLNLILADTVNLGQASMVVGHTGDDTQTIVVAQDPKNPEYGTIQLMFTPNPIELRQWVITDGGGGQTTVILDGLQKGGDFPPSYFNIPTETDKRLGD